MWVSADPHKSRPPCSGSLLQLSSIQHCEELLLQAREAPNWTTAQRGPRPHTSAHKPLLPLNAAHQHVNVRRAGISANASHTAAGMPRSAAQASVSSTPLHKSTSYFWAGSKRSALWCLFYGYSGTPVLWLFTVPTAILLLNIESMATNSPFLADGTEGTTN